MRLSMVVVLIFASLTILSSISVASPFDRDYKLILSANCSQDDIINLKAHIEANGGFVPLVLHETGIVAHLPNLLLNSISSMSDFLVLGNENLLQPPIVICGKDISSLTSAFHSTFSGPKPKVPSEWQLNENTSQLHYADSLKQSKDNFTHYYHSGPMIGEIGVLLIHMESDGSIDPNSEDWSISRFDEVVSEVIWGLTWWAQKAYEYGEDLSIELMWLVKGDTYSFTGYEPITRSVADQGLWINDIMSNFGYIGADHSTNVRLFARDWASEYEKDTFFIILVADSYNDVDGCFGVGVCERVAWARRSGSHVIMSYDNGTYGIEDMELVLAHEMGHIFWACDEYFNSECNCVCDSNPWQLDHLNCEFDLGCDEDEACLMKSSHTQEICTWTSNQIGWSPFRLDNDVCSFAEEISVPSTIMENMWNSTNQYFYQGQCGIDTSGAGTGSNDVVYKFFGTFKQSYLVELDALNGGNGLVYVRQGNCFNGAEISCYNNYSAHADVKFTAKANAEYFIFVETWNNVGDFQLAVKEIPADCELMIGYIYGDCGFYLGDEGGNPITEEEALNVCLGGDSLMQCSIGCYESNFPDCGAIAYCIDDNCVPASDDDDDNDVADDDSSDDDSSDDNSSDDDYRKCSDFCNRIYKCNIEGELEITSFECVDFCNSIGGKYYECAMDADNCSEMKNCFGIDDEDEDNDGGVCGC